MSFSVKKIVVAFLVLSVVIFLNDYLKMKKVDQYKMEIVKNIHVGIGKDEVEKYLRNRGAIYSYSESEHAFYALLMDFGARWLIYDGALYGEFYIENGALEEIKFRVEYSGM